MAIHGVAGTSSELSVRGGRFVGCWVQERASRRGNSQALAQGHPMGPMPTGPASEPSAGPLASEGLGIRPWRRLSHCATAERFVRRLCIGLAGTAALTSSNAPDGSRAVLRASVWKRLLPNRNIWIESRVRERRNYRIPLDSNLSSDLARRPRDTRCSGAEGPVVHTHVRVALYTPVQPPLSLCVPQRPFVRKPRETSVLHSPVNLRVAACRRPELVALPARAVRASRNTRHSVPHDRKPVVLETPRTP